MKCICRALLATIPSITLAVSAPAAAQDIAAAEALFNTGVAEMEAKRYDTACPAIAESYRLDPRPGTLFTLADCQDRAGKIATAVALYSDYLRATAQMSGATKLRPAERARIAAAQKQALAAQVPLLTLVLPSSAPPVTRVERDGAELSAASLGVALPIDPGEHTVTTQLDNGPAVVQRIRIEPGEKQTLEVRLRPLDEEVTPARAPAPADATDAPARRAEAPVQAADSGARAWRIGATIAGGIGAAGVVLGGVTGGDHHHEESEHRGQLHGNAVQCRGEGCCRQLEDDGDAEHDRLRYRRRRDRDRGRAAAHGAQGA